jgi:hypothetical protein
MDRSLDNQIIQAAVAYTRSKDALSVTHAPAARRRTSPAIV